MAHAACDVWLLTEVNERLELEGFHRHLSECLGNSRRRWSGILSRRPLTALPDPHRASAAATVDGVTYCSTILPWCSAKGDPNWPGETHADRTANVLDALLAVLPPHELVWGGDWNHAMAGPDLDRSADLRPLVRGIAEKLGLEVATADLPHREDGYLTTDHVAVSSGWVVTGATRIDARGLSDHDCYVIQVTEP